MILFPAIDLIGGKVVRLERGDRSRCKVYSDDPVAVARSFAEQGASWVHVVDLSAAFGDFVAMRLNERFKDRINRGHFPNRVLIGDVSI